jgi:SAM-dependent methyltransferase
MMSPKERCKDIRDRFYPMDERIAEVFFRRVMALGGAERDMAEIGCGREPGFLRRMASGYRFLYGFDPEVPAPSQQGNIRIAPGFAEKLELEDESVDVLTSIDVVEHLPDPRKAFAEFMRVLRPGGRILLITPNKFHPPLFAARMLSHRTRQHLNSLMTGTKDVDTFPTFYRLNSVSAFKPLARDLGLNVIKAEYISNHPQYLMFSRLCYRMGVAVERHLLGLSAFAFLRQYIFAELEKTPTVPTTEKKRPAEGRVAKQDVTR